MTLQQYNTGNNNLVEYVKNYFLDCYDNKEEEIKSAMQDLLNYGCQSGCIGPLIYYKDTHLFYDQHYNEIEEIREDLEDSFGQQLEIKGDLKNYFAWLGFEEASRKIYEDLYGDFNITQGLF